MPNETSGERLLARRYRLVIQVGRGGMGTVWQAHDEILGRDVAVKEVILPHGLTDEERSVQYKRTFREARTAARLGHPGVVTVYDVVEEDGRPWIIMELIKARSLDQVIKEEGPLPPRRAAEIGRQMLAALHAAHDAGVLHRDVKPSNVLITSTGREADRAVLTDFGIATASGDATLTQTGLVMGSPAYIAPERARGRIAGPASDLWSLGVTLYAMVHGKSPFERSEPMAALVAVISEEPDSPDMGGPLIPIIEGLLRKNPDVRMDAIEAGALLDEIVRQESVDTQRTMAVEFSLDELPGAQAAAQAPEPYASPETPYGADASYASETYADETYADPLPPASTRAPASGSDPAGFRTRVTPPVGDATHADGRGPADPARATSWFQDPGTRPAREVPGTASARSLGPLNRRSAVIIGVVVLVVVIAAASIALANSGGGDKPAKEQGSTSGRQGFVGRSPSGTVSPTERKKNNDDKNNDDKNAALPSGFHLYRDDSGYSLPVPDGWTGPERKQGGDFFYAPDRRTYLQIDQTGTPGDSALDDWRQAERGGAGFQNYTKINLGPTGDQPPVPDDGDGKKSADWEFTFDSGGQRMHILNRGFVTHDHGYAILLRAPDKDWSKTFEKLRPVYQFFQPVKD